MGQANPDELNDYLTSK